MEQDVRQVFDDLTGEQLIQSEKVTATIDARGRELAFTLDFEPKTLDALLSAWEQHDYAPLRKLFVPAEPEARPKAKPKAASKPRSQSRNPRAPAVREWANAQGLKVPERGRIPKDIEDRYNAAH
jgi:Lsr2 protein